MTSGKVVLRPAVPPPVRIRQNINKLAINDPIVVSFSQAIEKMQALPIDNALSWRYQAAIHDYPFPDATLDQRLNPKDENGDPIPGDPKAKDKEALPADRGVFWRQCQHGSWFFLPWHRMYLHHFEKIVMDQVAQVGGPKDWALPYWKWDATDGEGKIPVAFRSEKLGGAKNFLFVKERNRTPGSDANKGDRIANDNRMDKAFRCLKPSDFTHNAGFGGGASVRQHSGQGPPDPPIPPSLAGSGVLEATPHGSMHVVTGGGDGWMSNFVQAALDPIFWLHHCNIDRLWEVWIQRKSANRNPDDRNDPNDKIWLEESFKFRDRTAGDGTLKVKQVLNTRTAPLLYEYDDTTDPLGGA